MFFRKNFHCKNSPIGFFTNLENLKKGEEEEEDDNDDEEEEKEKREMKRE